jgi:hypothetical protein
MAVLRVIEDMFLYYNSKAIFLIYHNAKTICSAAGMGTTYKFNVLRRLNNLPLPGQLCPKCCGLDMQMQLAVLRQKYPQRENKLP